MFLICNHFPLIDASLLKCNIATETECDITVHQRAHMCVCLATLTTAKQESDVSCICPIYLLVDSCKAAVGGAAGQEST